MDTVSLISELVRPQSTYFDVGANIGLLALPVLANRKDAKVISIEASPDTFEFLLRTHADSPFHNRWDILSCACGRYTGKATFHTGGPANGAFDGLKDTGRGGPKKALTVEVRQLDSIWRNIGEPVVSVIKIDVEGAEAEVIAGARSVITAHRPALVVEWNKNNLLAFQRKPEYLFELCSAIGYRAYAHPRLCLVETEELLCLMMKETDTFLLLPDPQLG